MCGRYQLNVSASQLQTARPNTAWRSGHQHHHVQRQQVRPTNAAPVLVPVKPTSSSSQSGCIVSAELVIMKWGFSIPARDVRQPLINARSETLLQLPTFRRLLHHPSGSRRCAVPVTAFYEWHKSPPPGKQTLTPYLVRQPAPAPLSVDPKSADDHDVSSDSSQNISYLAALYDDSFDPQSADHSFVIITAASAPDFSWLHSRQPVFLSSEAQLRSWLSVDTVVPSHAVAALATQTSLTCTKMLRDLSAPASNQKGLHQKGISSFFNKQSPNKSKVAKPQHNNLAPLKSVAPQKCTPAESNDHLNIPPIPHSPSSDNLNRWVKVDGTTADPVTETPSKPPKYHNRSSSHHSCTSPLKPKLAIQKPKPSLTQPKQKKNGQTSIRSFFRSDN